MKLISREKFEYISKKVLQYPLHDAEKDYFLTIVMDILSKSDFSNKLVFKGGTAIYHCFLNQFRFSEDLDFTATESSLNISLFEELFSSYPELQIKKHFVSKATIKIERLKYQGILDIPNSIKLEVDKLQNVYLKPTTRKYNNAWGFDFAVKVMDPVEICAEKIRACNERFRYRDFYDLFMLVKYLKIDLKKSIEILPKKEIRKDITKAKILEHLKYASQEVSEKSDTVYYKEKVELRALKNFINNLHIPIIKQNISKENE